jgi:hypothetical protein
LLTSAAGLQQRLNRVSGACVRRDAEGRLQSVGAGECDRPHMRVGVGVLPPADGQRIAVGIGGSRGEAHGVAGRRPQIHAACHRDARLVIGIVRGRMRSSPVCDPEATGSAKAMQTTATMGRMTGPARVRGGVDMTLQRGRRADGRGGLARQHDAAAVWFSIFGRGGGRGHALVSRR